jgi:2-polyprenyl-3-methyl-5-hydroxy-6-metoxy-1,4-benzoquinol methylase
MERKGYPAPMGYQGKAWRRFGKILRLMLNGRFEGLPVYVAGGKILDVGCGNGNYLYSLRELGWETYGVEMDEQVCHYVREVLGLTVFQGTLEEAHLPNNLFDVVTMRHVLEHLPDPSRSLAEVYRLLRAGGSVLIETPNIESVQARFFRARWFHLDIPRHLYHFTPATLPALLQKTGFSEIRLSFLPSMTGITGSLQYRWNERAGTRGTGIHHCRVLAWSLWPVGLLAARLGYGECMRVMAVKT